MPRTTYRQDQKIGVVTLTARLQDIAEASRATLDQQHCLVDLDDCALDSGPRTVAILEEFLLEHHGNGQHEPEAMAERLRVAHQMLTEGRVPYLARELWQYAAPGTSRQLEDEWFAYWFGHFFTNEALRHDRARPGVVEFLTGLTRHFPRVGYLTGRHKPNHESPFPTGMRMGTEASLWRHLFPHGPLYMKPEWDNNDVGYKEGVFRALLATDSTVMPIGYIDNEPGCVLAHHRVMTEAGIRHLSVWFNGAHSTPADLPPEVLVLDSFVAT